MSWSDLAEFLDEALTVEDLPRALQVGVSEQRPSDAQQGAAGQIVQRVLLMVPSGELLSPPLRLMVRGGELRVLGTQAAPFVGAPSLVTCERVNLDLPDTVTVTEVTGPAVLNVDSGLYETPVVTLWSGAAHVASSAPATVDTGGDVAPLDRVIIAIPLTAPYRSDLRVEVLTSRAPGLVGARFKLSGEVLDSGASLRRVVGYRQGV